MNVVVVVDVVLVVLVLVVLVVVVLVVACDQLGENRQILVTLLVT